MRKILGLLTLVLISNVNAVNNYQFILHSGEKISITAKSNDVKFTKSEQFAELLFDINNNQKLNQCIVATSVSINKNKTRLDIRVEDLICVDKKGNISDRTIYGAVIGEDKIAGIKINGVKNNSDGSMLVNVKDQKAIITLDKQIAEYE